jgi:hypothetical protein
MEQSIKKANEDHLAKLKIATVNGIVVKGIKETLRVIKSQKAKSVFIAKNGMENYKNVIRDYCALYLKDSLFEVDDWLELRDIVIGGVPSQIIKEKALSNGKTAKITPKCYCAAIVEYGDLNKLLFK